MSERNPSTSTQQPTGTPLLSKSRFLAGLQCPKLLWHAVNDKEALPEPEAAQRAIVDQGRQVGQLAKRLFPDAVDIDSDTSFGQAVQATQAALSARKPVFEAAFAAAGACCRVDVLIPCPAGGWEVVEVKSSTSIKAEHLDGLAFQTWVLREAGLPVQRTRLMTINNTFVRSGAINPAKFFVDADATSEVVPLTDSVAKRVPTMVGVLRQPSPPEMKIGPHCDDPYTCPLHDQCWSKLPEGNVTELYRGGRKRFDLLDRGVLRLPDIDGAVKLTPAQAIQVQVASTGKPHVDKQAIAGFLRRLKHPVHYLDFETFATAIPLFDGTMPYQQIPFQFSLHIVRAPGATPEHVMFLAQGRQDPRPEFMQRLSNAIEPTGSIVAYNAAFELARLRECCDAMREHSAWLKGVERRLVDLLEPFRHFHYYHPRQRGSASMKAVLPALTGKGYDGLAIQEGGTASLEFLRVTFGDVDEAELRRVRKNLDDYCGQDTGGMIWIVDQLAKQAAR